MRSPSISVAIRDNVSTCNCGSTETVLIQTSRYLSDQNVLVRYTRTSKDIYGCLIRGEFLCMHAKNCHGLLRVESLSISRRRP